MPKTGWRHRELVLAIVFAFAMIALTPAPGSDLPKVSVTTYHNGISRQGANTAETVLTHRNVNPRRFGKIFSQPVDGSIYTQPLYVSGLYIPGKGIRNVVFVATQHDTVYAFDADSNAGQSAKPLWKASFVDPALGITPVSSDDVACGDIIPEIGITGTPVIDSDSSTLYVVSKTKENGRFVQRLHALDLATGGEELGGPVEIQASVRGKGAGGSNGLVRFDPLRENQRAGLLLQNGIIYIAWAAHCDGWPFHGWIIAYDAQTLHQVAAWNSTPDKQGGGIWQSGAAPAGNGEDIFFATGNGDFDGATGGRNFGDSIIRLGWRNRGLRVLDHFTPFDEASLNVGDIEPGSGGVVLFSPMDGRQHPDFVVEPTKSGTIYLTNSVRMGRYSRNDNSQIVQELRAATGGVWGTAAWWNNTLYLAGAYDTVKAFRFDLERGRFEESPFSRTTTSFKFPGPTPSISSNGTQNGIVWAIQADTYVDNGPAILHAYKADDLSQELYSSSQNPNRDNPGKAVKFSVPTVANGKVYVGAQGRLSVYGLR